ncbi:MAG TPA: DUF2079 domain-containing protein [Acidimicrobiales bacterium]|nr:DUF2079 domain-containing protein [Acidimicrobiales bacterium]
MAAVIEASTGTSTETSSSGARRRPDPVAAPVIPGDGTARSVRIVGGALLGLQLAVMLVFSSIQYSRFGLTNDFANYSQAWWALGHGHLDPYSTGFNIPFWRDNAEFILWPLSLLYHVDPHPVMLLWLQDVVVVLTEIVAFRWIVRVVETAPGTIDRRTRSWLAVGAAVVMVVNPWVYETIAYDFHFEPIAALFCVLVGYDLWAGRNRRLWVWVPLALVSHVLAGTYLVGIGLSAVVAGRRTRRPGAVVAAVGLVWVVVFDALGAAGVQGQFVGSAYGYLVGPHHGQVGVLDVVAGALGHPGSVLAMAGSHWSVIAGFVVVAGAAGLLSPWGLGMAVVVLVPNLLDASGLFIRYGASFQSWPAMPFLLVGSVMVLVRLLQGGGLARRVATVTAVVWATFLAVFAVLALPTIPRAWLYVSPAAASELAHIEELIPAGAEVIVSLPVVGRFAQRDSVYAFQRPGQTYRVDRREVVFVLGPHENFDHPVTPAVLEEASRFVERRLGARPLASGAGVGAFLWSPPPGTRQITLP